MSITHAQFKQEQRPNKGFFYKLVKEDPLGAETLSWLEKNNKKYSPTTLEKFGLYQAIFQTFDRKVGPGKRGLICNDPSIVFPLGPIKRIYCYLRPRDERWFVLPKGYGMQWIGDFKHSNLILCEGEWDFLRLQNEGFVNTITHTAGAGTSIAQFAWRFKNKRVWICYDTDKRGKEEAPKRAKDIFSAAREIRIIDLPLPGTAEANDVNDFFRLGGTNEQYRRILSNSRFFIPRVGTARRRRSY